MSKEIFLSTKASHVKTSSSEKYLICLFFKYKKKKNAFPPWLPDFVTLFVLLGLLWFHAIVASRFFDFLLFGFLWINAIIASRFVTFLTLLEHMWCHSIIASRFCAFILVSWTSAIFWISVISCHYGFQILWLYSCCFVFCDAISL